MRICLIANGYPEKREPQFGCFERDQALALKKAGHDVAILYIDGRFRFYWRKIGIKHFCENGIEVYGIFLIPTQWISLLFNYKPYFWVSSYLLNKLFKKYTNECGRPDVIYAHFLTNIAWAGFLRNKYKVPLVGMEHWSVLNNKELSPLVMSLGEYAYNNADKLMAVSQSLKYKIWEHFKKEAIVIHNMIGEEFLSIQRKETNSKIIKYVSTGSLIYRKGYDVLIQAFALASDMLPEWNLTIIGEGSEREKLQNMIDNNNLSNRILLVGKKNKAEIMEILASSSVFVLPSRAENFSVAVLEALSAGLPVIATTCGGIKECINDKNGILVPVEDVPELSKALFSISNIIEKYDNCKIAEECKRRFAPQVIAQQLIDIFETVINK